MKIFKYSLELVGRQTFNMPKGAEILTIAVQNEVPCIWAIVNTACPSQPRRFAIYGTGHEMAQTDDGSLGTYIGTFFLNGGALVFHVFELSA